MSIDFFTKEEIQESIRRIEKLLASGIFLPKNSESPLVRSAFIEIIVCLRDLMFKTEKYAERVDFDDDIVKTQKVKDVTDSITYVRDALCHLNSDQHYAVKKKLRASYNIAYHKGLVLKIGDFEQASDYDDDICFFFGTQKIYLKRHIIRAFKEAKRRVLILLD